MAREVLSGGAITGAGNWKAREFQKVYGTGMRTSGLLSFSMLVSEVFFWNFKSLSAESVKLFKLFELTSLQNGSKLCSSYAGSELTLIGSHPKN